MTTEEPTVAVDGRRERWAGHRAQRRVALVTAGIAAVDAHGPAPTIDEIAACAGVSRAVLYRYFSDINELHQAIAASLAEDVLARVLAPMSELSTARQLIAGIVDAVAGWVELHPRRYLLLRQQSVRAVDVREVATDAGVAAPTAVDDIQATVADRLADLLQMFMTVLGMQLSTAELAARALTGMVESAVHWWSGDTAPSRMPRSELVADLTVSAWAVIAAHLAVAGVELGFDDPLPVPEEFS